MDFLSRTVYLADNKTAVRLQMWDTAGHVRFRALMPGYVREARVAVVVYDVSDRMSFEQARGWVEMAYRANEQVVPTLIVVGNKADCETSDRRVATLEGETFAREFRAIFLETSAKTGLHVRELFQAVAVASTKGSSVETGSILPVTTLQPTMTTIAPVDATIISMPASKVLVSRKEDSSDCLLKVWAVLAPFFLFGRSAT